MLKVTIFILGHGEEWLDPVPGAELAALPDRRHDEMVALVLSDVRRRIGKHHTSDQWIGLRTRQKSHPAELA
jgi:hypothetical protein